MHTLKADENTNSISITFIQYCTNTFFIIRNKNYEK